MRSAYGIHRAQRANVFKTGENRDVAGGGRLPLHPGWPKRESSVEFMTSLLKRYWPECGLLAVASIEILWQLGSGSLWDWDEAIYAQVAWEILQGGNWLTLHWGYEPWLEKPPLLMWSTTLLYQLFGVDEFWSRAPSAFSGIALIGVTYATGKRLFGRHVGLLSAAVLLSSYDFVFYSRFGTTDVILTTFTWLALYGYVGVSKGNGRSWYLVWVAVALAVMVKSVAGLIGMIAIGLTIIFNRQIEKTVTSPEFQRGFLIALFIVAPWHLYITAVRLKVE